MGETCKACFSINIPEGCGICAEGLDCMPPKDDFGLLIIGADNICVDLEADKKKWQGKSIYYTLVDILFRDWISIPFPVIIHFSRLFIAVKLPPIKVPKEIEDLLPKLEEKGKPCNVKNGKCLPKCSDLPDDDINRGVQCELGIFIKQWISTFQLFDLIAWK